MSGPDPYRWEFKARFRRHAFGWRSQPAVQRVKQAVTEIKGVARRDPLLGAEGAVTFLERVSPALEHVDSSSGAIGTAVHHAIEQLVPVVAGAAADAKTRKRLARPAVGGPRSRPDAVHREPCRALGSTLRLAAGRVRLGGPAGRRDAYGPQSRPGAPRSLPRRLGMLERALRGRALPGDRRDTRRRHDLAVQALGREGARRHGKKAEAVRYAESCRGPWTYDDEVDAMCEEILLSSGLADEAYSRYGLRANRRGTYLATFRAVAKKYPHKGAHELLADLAATTPGEEAKWFAAAKEAGLYDEALALADAGPCDPRTLTRACRDFTESQPDFARGAGLLAVCWLAKGYGYEVTGADVWSAYANTMQAAEKSDRVAGDTRTYEGDRPRRGWRRLRVRSPGQGARPVSGRCCRRARFLR